MAEAATATEEAVELSAEEKAFDAGLSGGAEESGTDEGTKSEEEGQQETAAEETKEEGDKAKTEAEGESEEGESSEGESEEETKEEPAARNRRGYAERQAVRTAVTGEYDKLVPRQTKESLIENKGMDPVEAEVEALRTDMQRRDAIQTLTDLNNGLQADAENAIRDFPMFDENSPDFNKELTESTMKLWQEAAHYQAAPDNPNVALRADVPLYKFYAHVATAYQDGLKAGKTAGEAAGAKAAEKQLAAADLAPAGTQTKSEGVTDEDALFLKGLKG